MKQYSSSHDILVNGYEYFNKFLMTALLWMSRVTSRLHCAIRNLWIDESFHFCAGRVVKNVQNKPLNASTLEPSIVTLKSFIKVEWNSCRFNFTSETLLTSLDAHRGHGGHKKKWKITCDSSPYFSRTLTFAADYLAVYGCGIFDFIADTLQSHVKGVRWPRAACCATSKSPTDGDGTEIVDP